MNGTSEWFAGIPQCWPAIPIKHGFRLIGSGTTPPTGEARFYDGTIPWVNTSELRENVVFQTDKTLTTEAIEELTALRAYPVGTVLFAMYGATIGRVAILGVPATVNQAVCALADPSRFTPRFVFYGLQASREFLAASSTGGGQPNLNAEKVREHKLPCPDPQTQRAIADYLDRETARLDALVAAKERVLGLLAEKRRALITRAVTRGLDLRVPLRDSGIPWLGEIPAHWELKRAKWLFWERDQRSTTGEEVLLSLRMERGLVPHNTVSLKQTQPDELVGYKQVSTGEIVVNRMRAASGLVAIAPQDGLVSPDYAVFRVSPSANAEYFTHLFKTELMQAVFRSESTGLGTGSSGFLRLYSESFLCLWLPYPPAREKAAILAHVEDELAKLAAIHAATERTVTLLKERRAALIAAAVTGQIDVGATA